MADQINRSLDPIERVVSQIEARLKNGLATVSHRVATHTHGAAVSARSQTDVTISTSGAWQTGSPALGFTFVAPPSGVVMVGVNAMVTTTTSVWSSFEIRAGSVVGSGTSVIGASSDRGTKHVSGAATRIGTTSLVTGLTAGDTYNIQMTHWNGSAVSTTIDDRELLVVPVA